MSFDSDAAFVPDPVNYGLFFLLKAGTSDQWLRLWSGARDRRLVADATDTTGGLYTGLDFPLDIPDLELCMNGMTTSGEFVISGLSEAAVRLIGEDRDLVNGASIYLGILDFDREWQPTGPVDWLFEATAGRPRERGAHEGDDLVFTVTLPFQTDFYDREEAALAYWSPTSQRVRSPGDRFFDQVPQLSERMIIDWPN